MLDIKSKIVNIIFKNICNTFPIMAKIIKIIVSVASKILQINIIIFFVELINALIETAHNERRFEGIGDDLLNLRGYSTFFIWHL